MSPSSPLLSWRLDEERHYSHHDAVITTIDRDGRLVVPKPLRDRFNLVAGTELEIEATAEGLTLRKVGGTPSLVRKEGLLVHHGDPQATLDIVEFIRAERDARSLRIVTENSE